MIQQVNTCLENLKKSDINKPINDLKEKQDISKYEYDLVTLNGNYNKWTSIKNECEKLNLDFIKIKYELERSILCGNKVKTQSKFYLFKFSKYNLW